MLAIERHREILAILAHEGSARVTKLAGALGVTEETIRRDLDRLAAEGRLVRSHGGAVLPRHEDEERPFWSRGASHAAEKSAIADEALRRIRENDRILLDASSTAWVMARRFGDTALTVITNATQVAVALAIRPHVEVIMLGGRLAKRSLSFVGPTAEQQLGEYHADKLFLSCEGVDPDRGISDTTEAQAHIRRLMLTCADEKILLADHSKFGVRSLARIAGLDRLDEIITDEGIDPSVVDQLNDLNIKTTVVPYKAG